MKQASRELIPRCAVPAQGAPALICHPDRTCAQGEAICALLPKLGVPRPDFNAVGLHASDALQLLAHSITTREANKPLRPMKRLSRANIHGEANKGMPPRRTLPHHDFTQGHGLHDAQRTLALHSHATGHRKGVAHGVIARSQKGEER